MRKDSVSTSQNLIELGEPLASPSGHQGRAIAIRRNALGRWAKG
jgi:hypothetical protein